MHLDRAGGDTEMSLPCSSLTEALWRHRAEADAARATRPVTSTRHTMVTTVAARKVVDETRLRKRRTGR